MKSIQLTTQQKALLAAPLVVIPLCTLLFWAAGGGKGDNVASATPSGLNLSLPQAQVADDSSLTKFKLYEADRSAHAFTEPPNATPSFADTFLNGTMPISIVPDSHADNGDVTAARLEAQLAALQQHLATPATMPLQQPAPPSPETSESEMVVPNADDPGLLHINDMLDKILRIQHPPKSTSVQALSREDSIINPANVFAKESASVSHLGYTAKNADSGAPLFYGTKTSSLQRSNLFAAVLEGTQRVHEGSLVQLRLLVPLETVGVSIATGTIVFGKAAFQQGRLLIAVSHLRVGNQYFPVALEVIGADGQPGLPAPEVAHSKVEEEARQSAMDVLELPGLDPSIKAKAAEAGLRTLRSLVNKKQKPLRLSLPDGYALWLRNKP